jgi:hypothetical protein
MDESKIRTGGPDDALPPEQSASPRKLEPRPYDDEPLLRRVVDIHRRDRQQLTLLAVFHFVAAVVMVLLSVGPMLWFAAMWATIGPPNANEVGLVIVVMCLGCALPFCIAILAFIVGLSLHKRKRRMFCLVVAGIECLLLPLGTILGVFTLQVLMREAVQDLFASGGRGRVDPDDYDEPYSRFM